MKLDPIDKSAVDLTLADLVRDVRKLDLPTQQVRNMVTAINTACRVFGQPAQLVSAHVPHLRSLLAQANCGAANVTPSRWRNVQSDLNRALKLTGVAAERGGFLELTVEWEVVAVAGGSATERSAVRRFARFCMERGAAPEYVDDEMVHRYLADLEANHLSKTPGRTCKDLIRIWNRIAGSAEGALPLLTVPVTDRVYWLPWTELPQGLASDAASFRRRSLAPDWFEDEGNSRPVRESTADQRDRMLRRLASAEILEGVSLEALNSLADLLDPPNLRKGLEFMIERAGGTPNRQVFEMTVLAQTIGCRWCNFPEDKLAVIGKWSCKFRPPRTGMTTKNRERLRQFSGGDVIKRLVMEPNEVFARLRSCRCRHRLLVWLSAPSCSRC